MAENSASRDDILDMARGTSALTVFLAHSIGTFWYRYVGADHWLAGINSLLAKLAVLAFFLLSGYLITSSVLANIRRNERRFDWREYLASRLARIYPPFLASIVLVIVIDWVIDANCLPGCTPYGLPGDLFVPRAYFTVEYPEIRQALRMGGGLLEVNGVLWTLYIEFSIYILAMGVAMALSRAGYVARAVGVGVALVAVWNGLRVNEHFIYLLGIWIMGSALAFDRVRTLERLISMVAVAAAVGLAAAAVFNPSPFSAAQWDLWGYLVCGAICVVMAYLLFHADWPKWMRSNLLIRSASFSYSLYIVHGPLLIFCLSLSQNWVGYSYWRSAIAMVAAMIATLLFSYGFARLTERTRTVKRCLLFASQQAINVFSRVRRGLRRGSSNPATRD